MTAAEHDQKVFILGATSAIAVATARLLCKKGVTFYLVARNADRLDAVARDLLVRGASDVFCSTNDLADVSCHQELVSSAQAALGRIDIALISYGVLGDQATAQEDIQAAQEILNTNFLSPAMLTSVLAKNLELQRHGTLAVITSVAGDRGRRSNYIYGSAKAGLSVYLQGVRSRLVSAGVHVVTIKPGFVATPMTAHVPQGLLFVSAERIGKGIVRAVQTHRDVVYLPWFWRLIMIVIRTIPESIFKKLPI